MLLSRNCQQLSPECYRLSHHRLGIATKLCRCGADFCRSTSYRLSEGRGNRTVRRGLSEALRLKKTGISVANWKSVIFQQSAVREPVFCASATVARGLIQLQCSLVEVERIIQLAGLPL